jgi:nitrite reductase (NO-forming)
MNDGPGIVRRQLSQLARQGTTRREFLVSAALVGTALACERQPNATPTVPHVPPPGPASATDAAAITRFDPTLPPVSPERTTRIHWTARETPLRIRDDLVIAAWTFEGDIPGPIAHVRQGDRVEFTLTNQGQMPHSLDFHASQVDPKSAMRSVAKGESATYAFEARYPGAFLYHCGTPPVLMHIGSGMFGALIVDPLEPLAPAKEFVLLQSEFYLGKPEGGVTPLDYGKMLSALPDIVAFNGRPDQYLAAPIHVHRGELVRFYVVNAGPSHGCAFHIVGEQFDTVYLAAPPASAIHGVQTFEVAPGGGMIFELVADVTGEFVFVNHAFGHGQKGAMGRLVVSG